MVPPQIIASMLSFAITSYCIFHLVFEHPSKPFILVYGFYFLLRGTLIRLRVLCQMVKANFESPIPF